MIANPTINLMSFFPVSSWSAVRSVDEYAAAVSPVFDFKPLRTNEQSDVCLTNGWEVGPVLFMQNATGPKALFSSKAHIEKSGHLICLMRHVEGHWCGTLGDVACERSPGQIFFQDLGLRMQALQGATLVQSVYISKADIGLDPELMSRAFHVDLASPVGCCIEALWDDVFAFLLRGQTQIPRGVINQLIACVKVALGTPAQREDVRASARAALNRAIRQFIETNLGHGDLSADLILKTFGVSRAGLYRLFEQDGGVRNYIMSRRVLRALLDISQRPSADGAIADAAEKWGFSSSPNFNRSVKRAYGRAPGSLFGQSHHRLTGLPGPDGPRFQATEFFDRAAG